MENQSETAFSITPVGVVETSIKKPFLKADDKGMTLADKFAEVKAQVRSIEKTRSRIVIHPDKADLLYGIESYSHLVILYWAHQVPEKSRRLTRIRPMGRKEIPEVGIFATSSPVRPNPVLTTAVRLMSRRDNVLEVMGLDAVDQSPVIDIKPYVPSFYPKEETAVPDWMTRIIDEIFS